MRVLPFLVALLALVLATEVSAHAMGSAHWRVVQLDAHHWDSRLRLPEDAQGRLLTLAPQWPVGCETVEAPKAQPVEEGSVLQWRMRCPVTLEGALGLKGFHLGLPDAVLEWRPLRGPVTHAVLSTHTPVWTPGVPAEPPPAAHYLGLGIHHILLGPDHLLFVFGLMWLWHRSGQPPTRLLWTVTAFTAAHSLTLAGATLRGWTLPEGPVEAGIAASILLLAVEIASGHRGLAFRRPAAIAFGFGLLHGFGFAGAIAETGLPEAARFTALAAFNLGIELGQLAFVAVLLLLRRALRTVDHWAPIALCAYGTVAAYWTIERSLGVLTP